MAPCGGEAPVAPHIFPLDPPQTLESLCKGGHDRSSDWMVFGKTDQGTQGGASAQAAARALIAATSASSLGLSPQDGSVACTSCWRVS